MNLQGKKVLVTGAGGFIGSHLVETLVRRGCRVRAFLRYNALGFKGWMEHVSPDIAAEVEVVTGDVRDYSSIQQAVQGQDVVFHLAALISIPYSYRAPESFVRTNVDGTLHILRAAQEAGVQRILVTSTSEVYGTARYVPIDEQHPRQAQSPYAATKIAADSLAESFYRSYDLPISIVRPFNTYGPRQSPRAIVPTIITQLLQGRQKIQLGALHPTRDLVFVQDTVDGFIRIAETEALIGKEINIATGKETTIGDLAQFLIQMINPTAEIEVDPARLRPKKSEVERLCGDASLLRELTGWQPIFSLKRGLEITVEWFKRHRQLLFYKADEYAI